MRDTDEPPGQVTGRQRRHGIRRIIVLSIAAFIVLVGLVVLLGRIFAVDTARFGRSDDAALRFVLYRPSWGEVVELDAPLVAAELEKRYPRKIDLESVVVDGTEYGERLEVALSSGAQVDAFLIGPNDLDYYRRRGVTLGLRELLESEGRNLLDAFPSEAWNFVRSGGEIYGVPGYSDPRGPAIVVRLDVLKRYGLPLPATIDELETVSARLLELDPDLIPITGAWWDFAPLLCPALGIPFWAQKVVDERRQLLYTGNKSIEFVRYFQTLDRWADRGYLDSEFLASNFARNRELFLSGRTVFLFNHVERTDDWGRELLDMDPNAEVGVIPELNGAGVWLQSGEVPHVLVLPEDSQHPAEFMRYLDWLYGDPNNYRVAHLGIEGVHYERQEFSFAPILPVRYRDVFMPVFNERFALPDATRTGFWYEAIDKVHSVAWRSDPLAGLWLDHSIEASYPKIDRFDQEWWRYLSRELEPTRENYEHTLALYFDNGGTEVSRDYYRQYTEYLVGSR